jgi:hypothetical protein
MMARANMRHDNATDQPPELGAHVGVGAEPLVSALFVERGGCYFGVPSVDPWDLERDATQYAGPNPVVAHPPCQRWGNLARVCYARWGGEHNLPGNDGGAFQCALDAVRRWGGVLEHPAHSWAFSAHGLPAPVCGGWQRTLEGGWVCEVWQSAYGHRANKATWLYYSGSRPPFSLRWHRPKGTHQVGRVFGTDSRKPYLSRREAAATPDLFRDALLSLARHSSR